MKIDKELLNLPEKIRIPMNNILKKKKDSSVNRKRSYSVILGRNANVSQIIYISVS